MSGFLPLLFCGGGMALCMLLMSRKHGASAPTSPGDQASSQEVTELREEVERLRGELETKHNEKAT